MENAMAVTDGGGTRRIGSAGAVTKWLGLYWLATTYVVLTSFGGGIAAILHAPPVFDEMLRLGYPPHFSTLLGVWKVLGAAALSVPRRPLLKEWAYAGLFVDFSGAMVAYASVGSGLSSSIGPALAMGALMVSWHLRPPSRRLAGSCARGDRDDLKPSEAVLHHAG
jgi:hypothetical protein